MLALLQWIISQLVHYCVPYRCKEFANWHIVLFLLKEWRYQIFLVNQLIFIWIKIIGISFRRKAKNTFTIKQFNILNKDIHIYIYINIYKYICCTSSWEVSLLRMMLWVSDNYPFVDFFRLFFLRLNKNYSYKLLLLFYKMFKNIYYYIYWWEQLILHYRLQALYHQC